MRSLPKAKTLGQGSEPFREDPHDVVAATTELTSHSKERGNVAEVHDRTHRDSRHVADGRGPTAGGRSRLPDGQAPRSIGVGRGLRRDQWDRQCRGGESADEDQEPHPVVGDE